MSEDVQKPQDELTLLKQRATQMGITFSPNIGIETLRQRINDKMEGKDEEAEPEPETQTGDKDTEEAKLTPAQYRQMKKREAEKLIRVRITNMNPQKTDLPGEVFTVANGVVGTIRKYVPFGGEAAEVGYHVPQIILNMLKRRKFYSVTTKRDDKGRPYQVKQERNEFAIEILEPLTQEELEKLALDQRASGRV